MGYNSKLKNIIKVDLSELGDNNGVGFFIEMRNPEFLNFQEAMEAVTISKIYDIVEKITATKDFAKTLIISWNLLDMETELPVAPTDEDVFNHIPSSVAVALLKIVNKPKEENVETKNS